MTCDELRPGYLLYAIGVLEEPERTEMREHLDRGCEICAAAMREARAQAFAIGATSEGPEPSRQLRGRILAAAGGRSSTYWRAVWAAAGVTALAAAILIAYQARNFQAETARMRVEAAAMRAAFDLIQAPETRSVAFGQGQPAPPRGRVFFHPSGVVLIASHLPAPPPGKAYEMWIIPHGGKPVPAGLFRSTQQGSAIHLYRPTSPPVESDTVAVTLEAAAGVDAPTSTPVIVAPL